ncbi:nitrile hydratase accessory protein [Streptomyces sp. NPDC057474]|uniref:nitrile hydratase accessory protein n=1 Tax=Streptomyces sp. NPDC057474 TaxID=3346144 RepID=UPI003691B5F2
MSAAATVPAPYSSATTQGESRREVEELICGMPVTDPSELGFEFPWEIRAFAMAVAAHKASKFAWSEFQGALISSIKDWETTAAESGAKWSYYEHWVTALEDVMSQHGVMATSDLDQRVVQVMAEPPNRNHHEAHTEPIAIAPATPARV